ncbi:MAG: GDSL-type esterase/lipase family protein [Verrucomicrobia bacterium]|nr:GDSL-type esterase/lipase family protein [Verrucomicrobiota bacterium]
MNRKRGIRRLPARATEESPDSQGMVTNYRNTLLLVTAKTLIALWALLGSGPAKAGTPVRIECVGDSITAGYTDNPNWTVPFEFGYRSGLYKRLTNAGYPFQFVGASAEPWNGAFGTPKNTPSPDLRPVGQDHHRGYGGWGTSSILSSIGSWLTADNPDVVLLMIGINDNGSVAARSNLNSIVQTIVTRKPNADVVVAQITPTISYSQTIVDYNSFIRNTLVPYYQAQGKRVSTVDQYSNLLTNGVIAPALFSNGINHPNAVAYDRMAQTWYDGMVTFLPRELRSSLSGNKVTIAWSPSAAGDRLQSAPAPTGPWEDVPGSPNPSFTTNATNSQLFFRVRSR